MIAVMALWRTLFRIISSPNFAHRTPRPKASLLFARILDNKFESRLIYIKGDGF